MVVEDRVSVSVTITLQSPGLLIGSKLSVITQSSPGHASVTHRETNPSPPPHLPGRAANQRLATQNLLMVGKSIWMVWMTLPLSGPSHLSAVLRHREDWARCVCVQSERTHTWWTKQHTVLNYISKYRVEECFYYILMSIMISKCYIYGTLL